MPLPTLLEKLYARRRFGIRPGIERVRTLLDRLGNPERRFPSIHVVGTNGKGSTTAFLSSILRAAGHRTARFTSPHLVSFGERFWIDGAEPDDDRLASLLERVLHQAPPEATFFEIVTALATLLFAEEKVELAVMEAGMGGRSDATAALAGIMTLITPIALDHCDYLGGTLELIATEKVAIAGPGSLLVSARQPRGAQEIVRAYGRCGDTRLIRADEDFSAHWHGREYLEYRGIHGRLLRLTPGIPGRYQAENAALALAAAEAAHTLGFRVSEEAMERGISAARWPGRMELVEGTPRLLLDGAHNPAGSAALADALADYRYRRLLLVAGVMADKDAATLLEPLVRQAWRSYCVTPSLERALAGEELARLLTRGGGEAIACGGVGEGISAARREASPDDLILITGSLFTVGEAKAWLTGKSFQGIRG